jgi:molybdopterin synthase catalytic subunit
VGTHCVIVDRALSLDAVVDAVRHPAAGAVVVMLGLVRDHTKKDGATVRVHQLDYEAYVTMAERVIDDVVDGVCAVHPGVRACVHHRTGSLVVGDVAVVVAASSQHRKDAFVACEAIIDGLKKDAPIWKREYGDDGVSWVGLGP